MPHRKLVPDQVPHDSGGAAFPEGAADDLSYPILLAPSGKANFPQD